MIANASNGKNNITNLMARQKIQKLRNYYSPRFLQRFIFPRIFITFFHLTQPYITLNKESLTIEFGSLSLAAYQGLQTSWSTDLRTHHQQHWYGILRYYIYFWQYQLFVYMITYYPQAYANIYAHYPSSYFGVGISEILDCDGGEKDSDDSIEIDDESIG